MTLDMRIETAISKINCELISAFATLDSWFDHSTDLLSFQPDGKWSAEMILEHVMLTNHYLLVLIDKGSRMALAQAEAQGVYTSDDYELTFPALEVIRQPGTFTWERQEPMDPSGRKPLPDIRRELREQLYRCLCHLDNLANGEGTLYKMTMPVNDLGNLDVYQYIYFLALYARRHVTQLEKIEALYRMEAGVS